MEKYIFKRGITRRKSRGGHKKNIAVLFSGRIKGYEACKRHLLELKHKYSPVFFCSLNKKLLSPYIRKFCKIFNIDTGEQNSKNKRLNLEPTVLPEWIDELDTHPYNQTMNVYSVLLHNKRAFDMVTEYQNRNNMRFDIILLYRADIKSNNMILLKDVKPNTVYIPEGDESIIHPEEWHRKYGINSVMSYGDYSSMQKYCEAVDNIQNLHEKVNVGVHHEGLILQNIIDKNLKISRFPYEYYFEESRHKPNKEYNMYD